VAWQWQPSKKAGKTLLILLSIPIIIVVLFIGLVFFWPTLLTCLRDDPDYTALKQTPVVSARPAGATQVSRTDDRCHSSAPGLGSSPVRVNITWRFPTNATVASVQLAFNEMLAPYGMKVDWSDPPKDHPGDRAKDDPVTLKVGRWYEAPGTTHVPAKVLIDIGHSRTTSGALEAYETLGPL
jgi:hypothetical protein